MNGERICRMERRKTRFFSYNTWRRFWGTETLWGTKNFQPISALNEFPQRIHSRGALEINEEHNLITAKMRGKHSMNHREVMSIGDISAALGNISMTMGRNNIWCSASSKNRCLRLRRRVLMIISCCQISLETAHKTGATTRPKLFHRVCTF